MKFKKNRVNLIVIIFLGNLYEKLAYKLTEWGDF